MPKLTNFSTVYVSFSTHTLTNSFFVGMRIRWTSLQKRIMLNHFADNIKKKKCVRKDDCDKFLQKFANQFEGVSWMRVKTFVFNEYRSRD